jgi:purine-nucleoside phosphorylase
LIEGFFPFIETFIPIKGFLVYDGRGQKILNRMVEMMEKYLKSLEKSTKFLKGKIGEAPEVAIILGSGLGLLADQIEDKEEFDYADIPGFVPSTIPGHAGKLILGKLAGKNILAMSGRFHLYEGHDVSTVVFPIRVFKKLGINKLIITNAAGGVNRNFKPGDLMIITDHIGIFAPSPLTGPNLDDFGPRFPDMSEVYDKELVNLAGKIGGQIGIGLKKGVYMYLKGPSYETPAEIRMVERFGIDAVGMSTVPEATAAKHAGMKVLGISCITNMASGILPQPLSHDEVKDTAGSVGKSFCSLVSKIVENWSF